MKKIQIHNGNLAINTSDIALPDYPDWFEDYWFGNYDFEEIMEINEILDSITQALDDMYPWLLVNVNIDNDWIEMTGNWFVMVRDSGYTILADDIITAKQAKDCAKLFELLVNLGENRLYYWWERLINHIVESSANSINEKYNDGD
jgi:hypothetical protein